jgi:TPR repeat protein
LGGPKNLAKARELYQKAADKGDADAAAALRRLDAAQRQTTSP